MSLSVLVKSLRTELSKDEVSMFDVSKISIGQRTDCEGGEECEERAR